MLTIQTSLPFGRCLRNWQQRRRRSSFVSIVHDCAFYQAFTITPHQFKAGLFLFDILKTFIYLNPQDFDVTLNQIIHVCIFFVPSISDGVQPSAHRRNGAHPDDSGCVAQRHRAPPARGSHLPLSVVTAQLQEIPGRPDDEEQAS